jgi:diaminohydroxyphosphoribosylaminopyrimidine deaminase/5-amino-6-(5-phosphoribosylamino)uracil reductase
VSLRGATAYGTLDPCNHHGRTPPCSEALIAAGVAQVVYALRDPNPRVDGAGERRLRAAGISVAGGLMSDESQQLNCGFVKRMATGMPRADSMAMIDSTTSSSMRVKARIMVIPSTR